jgi:hypothetical protein
MFPVHLFEEHSSTLPVWWQVRGPARTAVYLDAHLDLQQTSDQSLRALRQCRTLEQIKSLEAPHHLNPANRFAYGIENFLYPASRLGLIDRLVWVAPPHIPRAYSPSLLGYVEQMDGISFEELTGFVRVGERAIRGRLLGLDITICGFEELDRVGVGADYLLDVDCDYFIEVPGDRAWIDPQDVIPGIIDRLGEPVLATVSRAVSSGFTPLQFRFVGDYVAALLERDRPSIDHHYGLFRATRLLARDGAEAGALCRKVLAARPTCAASYYLLSLCVDDPSESKHLVRRAEQLDSGYTFDLSREACGFMHRRLRADAGQVQALCDLLERLPLDSAHLAPAEIAVGQLCAGMGRTSDALRFLGNQAGDYADHGDLALAIAHRISSGPEPGGAVPLLERARRCEKTRTGATLSLGDLALSAGNLRRAMQCFEDASARAPAWGLPLARLRLCAHALGDRASAQRIEAELRRRERVLSSLPGMH